MNKKVANAEAAIEGISDMQRVYRDPKLRVSRGDFERPAKLDIEINCAEYKQNSTQQNQNENFDNL